jgi:hypothetical protein
MRLYSWSIAQQPSWCIRALAPYNSLHEQKCSSWKASQRQPETPKTESHSLFSHRTVETDADRMMVSMLIETVI